VLQRDHVEWQLGQAWIAVAGGADPRSSKNAAAPLALVNYDPRERDANLNGLVGLNHDLAQHP
jgi:hypothetical protein